jgi:hypothetical protein
MAKLLRKQIKSGVAESDCQDLCDGVQYVSFDYNPILRKCQLYEHDYLKPTRDAANIDYYSCSRGEDF